MSSPEQSPSYYNASRAKYEKRMHKVLAYIDQHLDQELDLMVLATVAHFSPYHFHRLFSAWMGETLGDYLRRRRLEVAALKLSMKPHLSIFDVAFGVGFASGEAFSRAFKTRFGSSPSAWRRDYRPAHIRNHDQIFSQIPAHNAGSFNAFSEVMMDVKIVDRAPVFVAYLRHVGPYGMPINQFWREKFFPWLQEHNFLGRVCYGIGHDNPEITEPAQCRYDACVELPAGYEVPRDMLTTTIPGGKYAVLAFDGGVPEIANAWKSLFRDWLPSSGYEFDARPCFEIYPPEPKYAPESGRFSCDICIPVRDLT